MFEGGIRVPFIAKFPKRIPAGTVSNEFCCTMELFPTFVSLAGGKPPKGVILNGFDMMPILKSQEKSKRKDMFWEAKRRYSKAARVDNWKYVEEKGEEFLFDLSADIGEQNNLTAKKPEKLKEMRERWAAWRKEMDETEPRRPFKNY